ncbi:MULTISPECIES: hypothetical protein [unclassified Streptomyces]|uniref:hypothetical protein n=1 Tax=unclassified Streptomyces TaxID=2593676 RepID=UPI0015E0753D|nr:hypothetical protein [Streptomyces sp. CB02959]
MSKQHATGLGDREYPIEDKDLSEEQNTHLTTALRAVRDNASVSPDLKDLARAMLSGRLEIKDVLDSPSGHRALTSGLAGLRDEWRALPPEQRQTLRHSGDEDGSAHDRDGSRGGSRGDRRTY